MVSPLSERRSAETVERKQRVLDLMEAGLNAHEAVAHPTVAVSFDAYRQWRKRDRRFAAAADVARTTNHVKVKPRDLTSSQFAMRYFGRVRTSFQQEWINAVQNLRPGNILLALWPPEYGKTTTFEDYATEMVARHPNWRNTTASEADTISKRIVGRVRNRLEPGGPFPQLVKEWGPFRADGGGDASSRFHQPWNNTHFNVAKKQANDERDHSMLAIGWNSSTVSIRTDHLHVDDLQSLKTLGRTPAQLEWFRQDALSRPGESGITTVSGTRVGHEDFYEALLEDDELDGILEVKRFPAILFDAQGDPRPLWPDKHSLEQLDRIRRKIKDEAFDRSYMMAPGASKTNRTFTDEGKARALNPARALNVYDVPSEDGRPPIVLSLDPGLDPGKCTLMGWMPSADKMTLVHFAESDKFMRNEEIIEQLRVACSHLAPNYKIMCLVVEAMNFQRGLARDERLKALKDHYGFTMHEHLTGNNKYDPVIGIASMAGDWEAGKIELPYHNDQYTRTTIDEMCRQLKTWRPYARGNKLRQDRVVVMWFAWIWWQKYRTKLERKPGGWKREGLPYGAMRPTPIIPIGAKI